MPAFTNYDYLKHAAQLMDPVPGISLDRGIDSVTGLPSPIEEKFRFGDVVTPAAIYQRPDFFTKAAAKYYLEAMTRDTGRVWALEVNDRFKVDPADGRNAYYLRLVGTGVRIQLQTLRQLASTGNGLDGWQKFSDKDYVICLDGPGTFSFRSAENPEEGWEVGFTPQRR